MTPIVRAVLVIWSIFLGLLILGVLLSNNTPSTNTSVSNSAMQQNHMIPAKYDELATVVSACGQPTSNHPQELNAGAGSEGRAVVYRRYNTELWFYRGSDYTMDADERFSRWWRPSHHSCRSEQKNAVYERSSTKSFSRPRTTSGGNEERTRSG